MSSESGVKHLTGVRVTEFRGAEPDQFCLVYADPLQLHWVKYGGLVYRLGLLPPTLIRLVRSSATLTRLVTSATLIRLVTLCHHHQLGNLFCHQSSG